MKCKPRKTTEILQARNKIMREMIRTDLNTDTMKVLVGMSVALQWVSNDGGETLQRLLDGEPLRTAIKE